MNVLLLFRSDTSYTKYAVQIFPLVQGYRITPVIH